MSRNYNYSGHSLRGNNEVLFFGRSNCAISSQALSHLNNLGFSVTAVFSKDNYDAFPENINLWEGDYIFCFRSKLILPKYILNKARKRALNFHPGSPEYPGSGCLNFALYEKSEIYGVTAHLMSEKVDAGDIVDCHRFSILKNDTVESLLERTHTHLLLLFIKVTNGISTHGDEYLDDSLKHSINEKWSGIKRTIDDLNMLSLVNTSITKNELENLIRATYTELYPPKIILHGYNFFLKLDLEHLE